jgi:hypothetical protein
VLLADDFAERRGAIFSRDNFVAHAIPRRKIVAFARFAKSFRASGMTAELIELSFSTGR